jgi:hypothetical protein
MCWGHEEGSTSFYTFLSVIRTITASRCRISRLNSCFTCIRGKFQSHRNHLLSNDVNTAARGYTVYYDGPVLIFRRNLLRPSIQYSTCILRLRQQTHQVNRVANCQTTRHHISGNRNSKVAATKISLTDESRTIYRFLPHFWI